MKNIVIVSIMILSSFVYSECYELSQADCLYWSQYWEWNEDTNQCQEIGGGGDNGGGNTGYNYDPSTGIITIDTSMIYQTLQNTGGAIALSGSDTFDNRGIIVLRTSNTGVRALSRNCTHAGFTVNINTAANNLVCPSHNSIFDLNGNVVSGPASGALTRYSASLSGSIITISQGA